MPILNYAWFFFSCDRVLQADDIAAQRPSQPTRFPRACGESHPGQALRTGWDWPWASRTVSCAAITVGFVEISFAALRVFSSTGKAGSLEQSLSTGLASWRHSRRARLERTPWHILFRTKWPKSSKFSFVFLHPFYICVTIYMYFFIYTCN